MTDRFIPDGDDEGRDDEAAAGDSTWAIGDADDWADPFDIPVGEALAPAKSGDEEPAVIPEPDTPPAGAPAPDGDGWGLVDLEEVVAEDPWAIPPETQEEVAVAADPIEDPAREIVVDPLIDWPEDIPEQVAISEEAAPEVVFSLPEESVVGEGSAEEEPPATDETAVAADPFADAVSVEEPSEFEDAAISEDFDLPEAAGESEAAADLDELLFVAEAAVAADPFVDAPSEEFEAVEEAAVSEDSASSGDQDGFESPRSVDELQFVAESPVAVDPFADALPGEVPEAAADASPGEDADSPEGIEWVFLEGGDEGGRWGFVTDVVPEESADLGLDEDAQAAVTFEGADPFAAGTGTESPAVVSAIEEEFRLDDLRGREGAEPEEPQVADDEMGDEGSDRDEKASRGIVVVERGDRKTGKRYLADAAWLGGEALARKVLLEVVDGRFVVVKPSSKDKEAKRLRGIVLPGLVNTHSHAFHRLLRGRTHRQGGDFWSWRDRMFDVAVALDPVGYEDVATAVFVEMAMAGITTVGEFHYLHHKIGGLPYRDPNEMGHAMIRAARRAGIRIGLLDAGYLAAGFGRPALHPVQERFSDRTGEAWLERAGLMCEQYGDEEDVRIGLAPHSVRAVPDDVLRQLAEWRNPETKLHIHVSEQPAENLSCMAAHGLTPVGLLESVGLLGPNTTAVHATHLTGGDIEILGSTHTGVCLCPTTERDLADGIGPSRALRMAGSTLTVGSDSHSEIDLFEEARGIEHHHRLAAGRRGGFAPATLLEATTVNGAAALGFETHGLQAGAPADFIVLDTGSPRLAGLPTRAESLVFAASASDVRAVYVGGKRIVHQGMHPEWKKARKTFNARR